jgi:hypothetical protein
VRLPGGAICVARLADQNQQLVLNWIFGAGLPPGGVKNPADFPPAGPRDAAFLQHVHFWPKKMLCRLRTKLV